MVTQITRVNRFEALETPTQLTTRYDAVNRAQWCLMHARPRPCFSQQLLRESRAVQRHLLQRSREAGAQPVDYLVLASAVPGVFNLGGDLQLFVELIRRRDHQGLLAYAQACIDVCYHQATNLEKSLTTIALVQGDALGGGFEAALSCSVLIAERHTQMGLPEILFNLFPGMGAFSFLARRLDPVRAERLILSGKLYSAEELHDMGVVDVLAETDQGELAVAEYIRRRNRSNLGYRAMQRVREIYHPIRYDELMDITRVWVDTALQLTEKDLKTMERLVRAQERRLGNTGDEVHPAQA